MSGWHRTLGLVRSLAVYYAIPFRQRRLRALYRQFAGPGDLVFDIGAHLGNRSRAFASLGCRVLAVEPQPHVARLLRRLVRRVPSITVLEHAVTDREGHVSLAVSERTPTVSTIAADWRDARAAEADFTGVTWDRTVEVPATTLDALIAAHGRPAFVKVDVEGGELAVLQGLSTPLPALSFEYLPQALDAAVACTSRLERLGPYEFNWSAAESSRLELGSWVSGAALVARLRAAGLTRHGDIYARLPVSPSPTGA